jgi:ATP-binding cassette, subfamily B (MDR/TAP), member 1
MVIWNYTGEVNSKRLRENYLKAVLRQNIAYFDTLGPGEVATRIQTDTRMPCSYPYLSYLPDC